MEGASCHSPRPCRRRTPRRILHPGVLVSKQRRIACIRCFMRRKLLGFYNAVEFPIRPDFDCCAVRQGEILHATVHAVAWLLITSCRALCDQVTFPVEYLRPSTQTEYHENACPFSKTPELRYGRLVISRFAVVAQSEGGVNSAGSGDASPKVRVGERVSKSLLGAKT
jgi:hypothetical protein